MKQHLGLAALFIITAGIAFPCGVPNVPEIDPAAGIGALALLSGAVLVLRARTKK